MGLNIIIIIIIIIIDEIDKIIRSQYMRQYIYNTFYSFNHTYCKTQVKVM
jgi:hypothetical protein